MYQINTLNLHKVICQLCLNKIKNKYKKLNPKDMPTKVSKKKQRHGCYYNLTLSLWRQTV